MHACKSIDDRTNGSGRGGCSLLDGGVDCHRDGSTCQSASSVPGRAVGGPGQDGARGRRSAHAPCRSRMRTSRRRSSTVTPVMGTPIKVKLERYLPDMKWETTAVADPNGGPVAKLSLRGENLQQDIWLCCPRSREAIDLRPHRERRDPGAPGAGGCLHPAGVDGAGGGGRPARLALGDGPSAGVRGQAGQGRHAAGLSLEALDPPVRSALLHRPADQGSDEPVGQAGKPGDRDPCPERQAGYPAVALVAVRDVAAQDSSNCRFESGSWIST